MDELMRHFLITHSSASCMLKVEHEHGESLFSLEHSSSTHTSADAHTDDASLAAGALEMVHQGRNLPTAGASERVAEGDGAAERVEPCVWHAELLDAVRGLRAVLNDQFILQVCIQNLLLRMGTWAANASLISKESMSLTVRPAAARASGIATAGPTPISSGLQPTTLYERMQPIGVRPSSCALDLKVKRI